MALSDLESSQKRNAPEGVALARRRVQSARDRLLYFDIAPEQIDEIEKEKNIKKTMPIRSLLTGIVTKKNIVEGDSLKMGMPAYEIADLSTVWVIGKVYESDLPVIRLGQETHMTLDYLPGRTYRGRVTYIYPYLQKGTREIPVRMEFHNPGYDLKPGMYTTIELQTTLSEKAVLVPDMAVIVTGERKTAFVMREPGKSPMGMDLVPVYEDEVRGGPTITIDPVTEQNMGLRYDVVRVGPLTKTVRTVGMIDYDENGLGTVTTKIDGWVEKLYVEETGTQVHKGDSLF